ncbi:MAG: hypothetical protein WCA63_01125 [Gallionella sp.]
MRKTIKDYRENVSKRLMIRQGVFFVIISILMVISIVNISNERIGTFLAVSGFLLALAIGLALSRMFRIFWNQEQEKVVSKLDRFGTILLIGYICAEVGRKFIFQYWLSGAELNAFGLVILTGLLLGRFLGTTIQIKNVLRISKPK